MGFCAQGARKRGVVRRWRHSQKFLTSSWLCVAQPGRVREPTADRGRWSPQRCAGIQCSGRSWRKKRSVLYQELSLARKPFLYIYFPWLPLHPSFDDLFFCLLVEAISLSLHSDSHTPYEVFLNKFLWPMCWSFGIWLEWGSGLRTFKFTAPLENLVFSWVRRVVGDDCVEILRVGF